MAPEERWFASGSYWSGSYTTPSGARTTREGFAAAL